MKTFIFYLLLKAIACVILSAFFFFCKEDNVVACIFSIMSVAHSTVGIYLIKKERNREKMEKFHQYFKFINR